MVRLCQSLLLPLLAVTFVSAQLDGASNPFGANVLRSVLARVGVKESTVDRILKQEGKPKAEGVIDLNDSNWEAVLRTGTVNPLASALPISTIWVITVYGQDGVSPMFVVS